MAIFPEHRIAPELTCAVVHVKLDGMRLVRNGPELEQGPVQAHRGEAEGPVVGGLPALFLCPGRQKAPPLAGPSAL